MTPTPGGGDPLVRDRERREDERERESVKNKINSVTVVNRHFRYKPRTLNGNTVWIKLSWSTA